MKTLEETIDLFNHMASTSSETEVVEEYTQVVYWLEELKQRRLKDERAIQMKTAAIQAGLC